MRTLKLILFSILPFLLGACSGESIQENMSEEIAHFEFTNQDNEIVSLEDLDDKWWIADFMYTNCTTACPMMTANLHHIQTLLEKENIDIEIVSFSVDPEYDTPEILTDYIEGYGIDTHNWNFLTGYSVDTIQNLSVDSFKTTLQGANPTNDIIAHGTSFFLINPDGIAIKKYDGMSRDNAAVIVEDLKAIH